MSYITSILEKIADLKLSNSAIASKLGLDAQIITDMKNGKRKQLYVEHVIAFSKALNYDFFKEIQEDSLNIKARSSKKIKLTVQIEVDETSKERLILEQIFENKQVVKKLMGE